MTWAKQKPLEASVSLTGYWGGGDNITYIPAVSLTTDTSWPLSIPGAMGDTRHCQRGLRSLKGLNPHCGPTIRHLRDEKEDSDGLILVYKNSALEDTGGLPGEGRTANEL